MALLEQRSESVSALSEAERSGLFFLPTPGPGDSEGGEIYPPASGGNDAPGTNQAPP
jgi:hypothetical protein